MGLWLEHRDEKGTLLDRAQFRDGIVELVHLVEVNGDGSTSCPTFTVKQAVDLAKLSSFLPPERRDWALRISFDA
jgi:hypothetical protein